MTLRVGVLGAGGRMGSAVCDAVVADVETELVAVVDPQRSGDIIHRLTVSAGMESLAEANAEIVVDFTNLEPARANLAWLADQGMHAVVGTTGFSESDLDRFRSTFGSSNCLIAPNFAIGAVLMMRFAELAAPHFDTGEIIELHHDNKIDAPSGTAMRTVERMAAASSDWGIDPTTTEVLAGARGGTHPSGIRVHSVRMRGMVAHQEVLLGTMGETLSIRHDSYDRTSFMPGVLLAVKAIADRPGLTLGIEPLLGL